MWLLFSAILAKNWRRTGNIGQKTVSYIVGDSKWMMEKLLIYYGKEMRLGYQDWSKILCLLQYNCNEHFTECGGRRGVRFRHLVENLEFHTA